MRHIFIFGYCTHDARVRHVEKPGRFVLGASRDMQIRVFLLHFSEREAFFLKLHVLVQHSISS
jgi:hypothetical protein